MDLDIRRMLPGGPHRVLVSAGGDALPSARAREQGVIPDVIFVRRDGWSLAAPARLERVAYQMWADEWTHFVRRPSVIARPIEEYKEEMRRKNGENHNN